MKKERTLRPGSKTAMACLAFIWMGMSCPVFALQERQREKEYVQVVNMELILRVFKDGSPVAGLKKTDFSLYEDGVQNEINGFVEIHRRMAPADAAPRQPRAPRLYLLFFWIDDPAADVGKVLDRFFSSLYREGDRVILGTPQQAIELNSPRDIPGTTSAFLERWRQEARDGVLKRSRIHDELNGIFEDFRESENSENFLLRYSQAIRECQDREMRSDTKALEAMARSLLSISNDKFALVFFQHGSLPLLDASKMSGRPARVVDKVMEIERQAKTSLRPGRLSQAVKSLFIQANTPFHLLFFSPVAKEGPPGGSAGNPATKNEAILSGWEQDMREISSNTGGLILDGDRMVAALDRVSSFEDVYYHITYVPGEHGAAKRRLEVRVDQPGLKVIHGRMLEMKEPPAVKIAEISASGQALRLAFADFYPVSKDGVPTGSVSMVVTGRQPGDASARLLVSRTGETSGFIELPLVFPQPGTWDIEARVVDQFTGRQDMKKARVDVPAAAPALAADAPPDPALAGLLAKAAASAEELKKAAFRFFCREKVTEESFASDARFDRDAARSIWIYDYQIIGQDEKITENRVLVEKNRKKSHLENARLETVFRSFYPFYMPSRILGGGNQHLYRFRLLDKNKKAWHIAAVRNDPALPIPSGELWVHEETGAVLKIRIEQSSIVGFEKIAGEARKKGLRPEIVAVHEYGVVENGIRFPSRTTFIEGYHAEVAPSREWSAAAPTRRSGAYQRLERGHRFFERSRTYFEYDKYRFFTVVTEVSEKTE